MQVGELKRQGDLLIMKLSQEDFQKLRSEWKRHTNILAEGEATGHQHILKGNVQVYDVKHLRSPEHENLDAVFEVQDEPAVLKHPQHNAVTLEPGFFALLRQREYDPLEEKRRVRD